MFKEKNIKLELTISQRQDYITILSKIEKSLKSVNLKGQAEILQNLIDLIKQENFSQFEKFINSVDMWGGSGAVWEVYIENEKEARLFETEIINLIDLMETTKVLGKGIKSIRKLFQNNSKL